MPKFSIIVPTHNSEEFMSKCLDSIVSQTYKDYELIIICDKCSDNTEKVARTYTDKIIVTDYGNDGMARNAGLAIATGDWILFLDDDDWWLHEYVLDQIDRKLNQNPELDILCFSFIFRYWKYATPTGNNGGRWVAVWNKCWRRKFIGDIRFPNIYAESDVYFHNEVFKKQPKVLDWDMPMYYYNFMRDGSITANMRKEDE